MNISIYKNIWDNKSQETISILEFINNVKLGGMGAEWREKVLNIRKEGSKEKRQELKKHLPYVTISGTFKERKIEQLIDHSGFICLDIDAISEQTIIEAQVKLKSDPYVFAFFKSTSGNGLAVIVKIDARKHKDAFLGLERYYLERFGLILDKACKDVTRPRYITYDPDLFLNQEAAVFKNYLPKSETDKKIPAVISGKNDILNLIEQIHDRNIDLTDSSYFIFLQIGFALCSEYGEGGREYFHQIVQFSPKYTAEFTDKQYNHCLRSSGHGVSIGTLFYYAKNAGLEIISMQTRRILAVATQAKKAKRTIESTLDSLREFDNISEEDAKEVVNKVFNSNVEVNASLSQIESIELFLTHNFALKKNEITRFVENQGNEIDTNFINSIYIKARKEVDDRIKYETIDRLIFSDFVPSYNPVREYFESNAHVYNHGQIDKLADSIDSMTGLDSLNPCPEYKHLFIKKWLVGIIASAYGKHSPLVLVLTGGQGTGKTTFFRNLLPAELQKYYAESKLDNGTDSELLMTQKLIILDDEYGGKTKVEYKRLKELTSKDYFTLREPYGRKNVTLKRLAVLCGTSNDSKVLSDPTGNRRVIPINVDAMNYNLYNSIDKKELIMEAYHLYKEGFNYELSKGEIEILNCNTLEHEQVSIERELIMRHFKLPTNSKFGDMVVYLQASEIKSQIEIQSRQSLSVYRLSQELQALGYIQEKKKIEGSTRRVYAMIEITNPDAVRIEHEIEYENNNGLAF